MEVGRYISTFVLILFSSYLYEYNIKKIVRRLIAFYIIITNQLTKLSRKARVNFVSKLSTSDIYYFRTTTFNFFFLTVLLFLFRL